ncbi:MAG: DNA polymerase III subunit gamma/tau [Clostridia bacterium]|nr:DNA polymerase III subunit gamma/tau [Clostridia bacterium]
MAYTALYRKFRPLTFDDMVGQEHNTKTLRNQIISGRVGHAYLFNGVRGTGKTTTAKIMARAVNCLNPQNGNPCNECEICTEILEGSLTDVVEMDAASNNGVDDIRSIREEVNFLPTKAKYRIYIIDEVHMLSSGAFNALLKTLEEPPEHVKFILATTEPQKLPTTILSRCQRFDYKKISNQDIIKRLKIICAESNINIGEDALNLIAVLSEGAMRDAISILERCSQEETEKIEISLVKNLVGLPSTGIISKLVNSIFENDEISALNTVDEIIEEGKDLYNFVWEVIKYIKDVLLFKATGKAELYSKDEVEQIKAISEKASREKLLNIIYLFSDLERDIKWSEQKIIMLQTAIIKACAKYENNGIEELQRMVKDLEEKVSSGNFSVNNSNSEIKTVPKENNTVSQEKEVSSKVEINSDGTTVSSWRSVLDYLKNTKKMLLYTALNNTKAKQVGDMILEVYFLNGLTPFNQTTLDNIDNKNALNQAVVKVLGKEMHIKYLDAKGASIDSFKENKEESKNSNSISTGFNPMGDLGIDINIFE